MKNIVFILFALFSSVLSIAQNVKINGKVLDEKSNTVIAATVSLISKDSALISGTITDNHGSFELTTPQNAFLCFLRITHLEFENSYIPIVPDKDTTITVVLSERSFLLNEVHVTVRKPIYEYKNGNLIVNIGEIPNIQTYNAARLLQTLPGVTNSDGTLTLNGQPATVHLDGRKQTINPSQINTIIQSMPVAAIDKIELIYSSGGIYDASDGAIINIVYKKQKVDGYYLSVGGNSTAYDQNHLDGGSSATIMFKKKNVMLNSMLSYRNNYSTTQANDTLRYWNDAFLYQDRNSDSRTNVYMGMINLSWDVKKGHNLNFNFNFYDDFSNNTSSQQYLLQNNNIINRSVWNVKSKGNDDMWAGQIEYTSPDTLSNKFKASYGVIYGGLRSRRNTIEDGSEILYDDDEMVAHRHTIKIDYEHKFSKKMSLLLGLKTDLGQLSDDVIYTKTTDTDRYPASHFFGRENIYAGYTQLKYTLSNNWSANASLRAEHTFYYIDFMSQNEKITDSYTNLFPFLTVSYNANSRNYRTSLSFGSSISRPDYNNMLPGVRYSNQYSYTKGNPELKPRINHTLQWRNTFYQFINTYLGYESGVDIMGIVVKNSLIDPLVTEYEYQNIADYNRGYAGATVSYQILRDKVSGQVGGHIQHVNYRNPKNGYELPQGKSDYWQGTLNATCNYQITKQLGINYEYLFYPKYDNLVYILHTRWLMNAGIYYNSKNDKWSLLLDINDIFHSNRTFREMYFGGNYSREHNYRNSQYVQLSFIYKFKGGEKIDDKAKSGSLDTNRFSTK